MANPQPADTTASASDAPVLPVIPNPRGYPPFNLRLLPTYTNNQLRYYHISGAILNVDEEELARQMNKRHTALKAINWDRDTRENTLDDSIPAFTPLPPSISRTLSLNHDSEPNSKYSKTDRKGVKVSTSNITRLKYDSTIAEYNN